MTRGTLVSGAVRAGHHPAGSVTWARHVLPAVSPVEGRHAPDMES